MTGQEYAGLQHYLTPRQQIIQLYHNQREFLMFHYLALYTLKYIYTTQINMLRNFSWR